MRYPTTKVPGFGVVDRKFYSPGNPRKDPYEEEWSVEKEKALAGDMWRSLARLRDVGRVEVADDAGDGKRRRGDQKRGENRVGAVDEDGRVTMVKPVMWGTFIIEGEDGRIVVVDREGAYDSGTVGDRDRERLKKKERKYREATDEKRRMKEKEKIERARRRAEEEDEKRERERKKMDEQPAAWNQQRVEKRGLRVRRRLPSKLLTPITEVDTPEDTTNIVSPTNFFMTGGRSEWSSSVPSHYKPSQSHPPPATSNARARALRQPSPVTSGPPVRPYSRTVSTVTPSIQAEGSWSQQLPWGQEAPAYQVPPSVSSAKYSDATSSSSSGGASRDYQSRVDTRPLGEVWNSERMTSAGQSVGGSVDTWRNQVNEKSQSVSTSWGRSREPSGTEYHESWRQGMHAFEPRDSQKTSRSPTTSFTSSALAWDHDLGNYTRRSLHSYYPPSKSTTSVVSAPTWSQDKEKAKAASVSSHESAASLTPAVTPYSWRRQVEELSDHSTVGSDKSDSRVPSPIQSDDRGSDGETIRGREEDDRSVKSHSTYRAPMVEDAPDSEEGAQEWHSSWSVEDKKEGSGGSGQNGSDAAWKGDQASVANSAKWSGKTGWGGDVAPQASVAGSAKWDGSATGSVAGAAGADWTDTSGYGEGNETWPSSEVGGVEYGESEWPQEPPEGSWRDV